MAPNLRTLILEIDQLGLEQAVHRVVGPGPRSMEVTLQHTIKTRHMLLKDSEGDAVQVSGFLAKIS
jgi:hypothetical protein